MTCCEDFKNNQDWSFCPKCGSAIHVVPPQHDAAMARGGEMLLLPMRSLPTMAWEYMRHLSERMGLCIDVCLTAYTAYAQCVEGLVCHDKAYIASPDAVRFFKDSFGYVEGKRVFEEAP